MDIFDAAINGDLKAVEQLIREGVDVNAKNSICITPLHWAKSGEIAQLLIAAGADVNARDLDGNTPLQWARSEDVVKVLLEAGADPSIVNNEGQRPEDRARDENIKILLRETRIAQEKKQLEQDSPQNLPERHTPRIGRGRM